MRNKDIWSNFHKAKLEPTVIRVRYSETDRMGFVYHVNYLEYFELARSDWVRTCYRPYIELEDAGFRLVVIKAEINFISPAFYDDVLELFAIPVEWRRSHLRFKYLIFRRGDKKALCVGSSSHCFIDETGKPMRIPEDFRAVLDGLDLSEVRALQSQ